MTSVEYQILLNLIYFFLLFRIFIFLLQKNGMLVFGGFTLSLSYQFGWSLSFLIISFIFQKMLNFFEKWVILLRGEDFNFGTRLAVRLEPQTYQFENEAQY